MGTLQGVLFICGDVSEEEDHDFFSLRPITMKIGDSVGGKGNVKTTQTCKEGREKGWEALHLDILSPLWQIGHCTPALLRFLVNNG